MRTPDAASLRAAALTAEVVASGGHAPRAELAHAVRTSLAQLAAAHPGRLVEVRVPPFAAVQIGVPGQSGAHSRGTPPNVVETDAATWLALATGGLAWQDALAARRVRASGAHAGIAAHLVTLASDLAAFSAGGSPGR